MEVTATTMASVHNRGTAWLITLTEVERRTLADFFVECMDETQWAPPLEDNVVSILSNIAEGLNVNHG